MHCVHGRGLQEDAGGGEELRNSVSSPCVRPRDGKEEPCNVMSIRTRKADALLASGLGSVRFTVGLDDLKGLFQPKCFYDSMIL